MSQQQARLNMITQQLRANGVTDARLLEQFQDLAREDFVPSDVASLAYADSVIPLPHHQILLRPFHQALALQSLNLCKTDRVLEIGTGTGYLTAILARLTAHVLTVDEFPEVVAAAKQRLSHCGIGNVHFMVKDAFQHWKDMAKQAPFDVILCTAGFYVFPDFLQTALTQGGRLFAIIGRPPTMAAKIVRHESAHRWQMTTLFETQVPYANSISQPDPFEF